jgi:hypothetical protein
MRESSRQWGAGAFRKKFGKVKAGAVGGDIVVHSEGKDQGDDEKG